MVLLGLSMGLVGPVLANNDRDDDNSNNDHSMQIDTGVKANIGVDFKDLNDLRREENKMLKDLRKDKKEEKKEDTQQNHLFRAWKKAEKHISGTIDGQEKLALKLGEHLSVMASNSINVTDLKAKLSTAVSLINTSKISLADASVKASASIQTQTYDNARTTLKGLIDGIKDKIRASHQVLIDIMVGIRLK